MKTLAVAISYVMLCTGLHAQTPAKPATSNEDMNIRAYIELLRTDVRKSKSQIFGEVMRLDSEDAAKFWPIYKDFESEMTKIGDRILAVLKTYAENYDKVTDGMADQLANQVLSIEQQRNALKKKYYDRVKSGIGAITAMRFLQVENQLERLIDLQLAAQLPIVGVE